MQPLCSEDAVNYIKPREPGYYWYRPGLEWGEGWHVVKVEEYAGMEPALYFHTYGQRKSRKVSESQGTWGEKIADISEYGWTAKKDPE